MAELADAPDSKSGSRKRVGVRPSLWAPTARISAVVDLKLEVDAARVPYEERPGGTGIAAEARPKPDAIRSPLDSAALLA